MHRCTPINVPYLKSRGILLGCMLHLCSAGPRPGKVGQCTNAQRMRHVKVSKGAELSDTKHARQGIGLLRQQLRAGCVGCVMGEAYLLQCAWHGPKPGRIRPCRFALAHSIEKGPRCVVPPRRVSKRRATRNGSADDDTFPFSL